MAARLAGSVVGNASFRHYAQLLFPRSETQARPRRLQMKRLRMRGNSAPFKRIAETN